MLLFSNDLTSVLYIIPVLLFSVAVHEFSHAYIAYKLGDRSQKLQGRMTLDPFTHMDLFGFLSIMLIGFGWGKPVYVDDSNFKNRNRDNMLVSLAGPLSNIILALLFTIILKLLMTFNMVSLVADTSVGSIILTMFMLTIQFNVIFAVFNMLPFPPFDGSKVLFYFLPNNAKRVMYFLERYSMHILIILILTGLYRVMIDPIISGIQYLLFLILKL